MLLGRLALVHWRVVGSESLTLPFKERNAFAGNAMHVFEVAAEVTTLCERLLALGAGEGPLSSVLAEVVS